MVRALSIKTIASLLATSLVVGALTVAQQPIQQTRPRRVGDTPAEVSAKPPTVTLSRVNGEPMVRIGLAVDARGATVSSFGRLLSGFGEANTLKPLDASRVRLEPRLLGHSQASAATEQYRIEITGAGTRSDGERAARELKEIIDADLALSHDNLTATWRLSGQSRLTSARADALQAELDGAGFLSATVTTVNSTTQGNSTDMTRAVSTTSPAVRTIAMTSTPAREVVAFANGASRLFSSRAPVVFASDDPDGQSVRFNDKSYRGRIEVFANSRGNLTVVNILSLEDYVKGVVPNELSPSGFSEIEALKAQAVAARTYALHHRNRYATLGFDLLPTTRSQVYKGLASEHPLSSRAVDETRGIVAVYDGEPIEALYTSTCGGRTEDAENIFLQAAPYLRARECSIESHAPSMSIRTSREPFDIRDDRHAHLPRDLALLAINQFTVPAKPNDQWLAANATTAEIRSWISDAARLSRQPIGEMLEDLTRPPALATALSRAVFGESRGDVLMDAADVDYLLSFRDAGDVPQPNRADVAFMLREGFISLNTDGSLRPREPMTRSRAIHAIARILESKNFLVLQKAVTRASNADAITFRSPRGRDQSIVANGNAFLFRTLGDGIAHQTRSLAIVGGEPATYHVNGNGEIDFLEVRPAVDGAAADRFSNFSNWSVTLSIGDIRSRLGRAASTIGQLTDLKVAARGNSRRAIDLELIGTNGSSHIRGGRIRSALGLREQLFVIDRDYANDGRVTSFTFLGRGWGHGVGMCQVGAYGLARAGLRYDEILKAYYTGIELTRLY